MDQDYKQAYQEGQKSSGLTSYRQAIIRGIFWGFPIIYFLLNSWRWYFKIIAIIIWPFIYGAVASSKRFKGKL